MTHWVTRRGGGEDDIRTSGSCECKCGTEREIIEDIRKHSAHYVVDEAANYES
jgi:hypothetical protein